MSSFRTTLTESNMDLVMYVVREKDCNPSQAMNMLLENPKLLIEARSFLDGKTQGKIHPKKR